MSWEDDEFGQEFFKFTKTEEDVQKLYGYHYVAYLKIHWDTIQDATNYWNKQRKRVRVEEVRTTKGTPFEWDQVIPNDNLWLDMGARLFNEIRKYAKETPNCLRLVKLYNPNNKFDVRYLSSIYKMTTQKTVGKKK